MLQKAALAVQFVVDKVAIAAVRGLIRARLGLKGTAGLLGPLAVHVAGHVTAWD